MSYTVDVNILLYASDRESPFHDCRVGGAAPVSGGERA